MRECAWRHSLDLIIPCLLERHKWVFELLVLDESVLSLARKNTVLLARIIVSEPTIISHCVVRANLRSRLIGYLLLA